MTDSERLLKTLDFEPMKEGGACIETFYPWTLTIDRWVTEGLPEEYRTAKLYPGGHERYQRYLDDVMTKPVHAYERYLGLDGIKRLFFNVPFRGFDTKVLEETGEYVRRIDSDGWERLYYKNRSLVRKVTPVVTNEASWERLKEHTTREMEQYLTDENIEKVYGKYREDNEKGTCSIILSSAGFFWTGRDLMGDEEELFAFYEMPELLHEISEFLLEQYLKYYDKICDYIQPEVVYFSEDLSGVNGPMISPDMFDEFVGAYYKRLFPFLRKKGVKNIFIDTDGDFKRLIPNFIEAGVDGFLPMDVNAGMDIVKVREEFPSVKFIGGYNKLIIPKGKEAIDREFERLLPVIRQGGYVPGCDHQAAPSTSFENYRYYLRRLRHYMEQAGADHA